MTAPCRFVRQVHLHAQPLAEAAGATCRVAYGNGGHAKLLIERDGKTRITPLSISPRSEGNALKMKLADVRRILREMA